MWCVCGHKRAEVGEYMWNWFSSVSMKTIKTKLGWPGLHGKDFELPPHLVLNISSSVVLNTSHFLLPCHRGSFLLLLLPLFYFRKESHYVTLGGFQSRAILLPHLPSWTPLNLAPYRQFSDLCQLIWKSVFKVFDHKHFFWQKLWIFLAGQNLYT